MTSIFSNRFSYNLDRVNSSAKHEGKGSKSGKAGEDGFARLLADYEKKPVKTNDTSRLSGGEGSSPNSAEAGPGNLTNLGSDEAKHARGRLSPTMEGLGVGALATPLGHEMGSDAVKIPASAVKAMPPEARFAGPPEVPSVVSARRIPLGAYSNQARLQPDLDKNEIKDIIVTAGKYHGVDPNLSLAVAQAESSFNSKAVSSDGHFSKGIFQLLDTTAQDMMSQSGIQEEYEPFDPGMNAFLGVGYLRHMMDIFSTSTKLNATKSTVAAKSSQELEKLAVAAFNAGQGNVVRAQERALVLGKDPSEFVSIEPHLPASTREYVRRVTEIRESMQQNASGNAFA